MIHILRGRIGAVVGLLASAALGFLSRSGGLPPWWAKVLGVAFWACGFYWLVRLLAGPRLGRSRAAFVALIGGWAVELLQLTPLSHWIASKHWLLRAAVGEVFSVWDLPTVAIGVGLAFALDSLLGGPAAAVRPAARPGGE